MALGIVEVEWSTLKFLNPIFDALDNSGVGGIILKVDMFVIRSLVSGTSCTLSKFCLKLRKLELSSRIAKCSDILPIVEVGITLLGAPWILLEMLWINDGIVVLLGVVLKMGTVFKLCVVEIPKPSFSPSSKELSKESFKNWKLNSALKLLVLIWINSSISYRIFLWWFLKQ